MGKKKKAGEGISIILTKCFLNLIFYGNNAICIVKVLQRLKKNYYSINTVVSSSTEEMKDEQGKFLSSVVPAGVSCKANW